jgi:ubiquinone/menaquinone biosynthesis C-methylase UbiE
MWKPMRSDERKDEFRKLLARQADSLKPAREWFCSSKLNSDFSSVMEVGCGYGNVLQEVGENNFSVGLDINKEFLRELNTAGIQGNGHLLPFKNNSFDLVYCHFALLWFRDPAQVIQEMARVSKRWICSLAEYDYGARLDYPDEFQYVRNKIVKGIESDGGDPYVGRKLYKYFKEAGLKAEVGAYSNVMDHEQMFMGLEDEWNFLENFTDMSKEELGELKRKESESIRAGTRFLFTPVFFALARKE